MATKSDDLQAQFIAEVWRRWRAMNLALSSPIADSPNQVEVQDGIIEEHTRHAAIAKLGDVLKCQTLDPLTRKLKEHAPLARSQIDRVRGAIEQCANVVNAIAPLATSGQWSLWTENLRSAVRELESSPLGELAPTASDPLVTADQLAGIVFLARPSFRRYEDQLGEPEVKASGRRPQKWRWSAVRPRLVDIFPDEEIPPDPSV
jgi:hypothetical protein